MNDTVSYTRLLKAIQDALTSADSVASTPATNFGPRRSIKIPSDTAVAITDLTIDLTKGRGGERPAIGVGSLTYLVRPSKANDQVQFDSAGLLMDQAQGLSYRLDAVLPGLRAVLDNLSWDSRGVTAKVTIVIHEFIADTNNPAAASVQALW